MTTWQRTDARSFYLEHIEAARLALSRGDRAAAAAAFHSAIYLARGHTALQRELVSALVHVAKLEQELGRPAEAEQLLTEALETAERQFGTQHESLGPVLNELSRLHIRQSDHARAEAVLERLLRITRAKGEEHPDVATALAGLALVNHALGDDVAAEQRYREALRIREKALPPHHMATVVTMEQLSETCAARGNLAEALALLQRALPTREAALGSAHATVRALRSRIAALELRAANVAIPSAELPLPAPGSPQPPAATSPSTVRPARRRVARYASAGVAAIAIATTGLSVGSRAGRGSDHGFASAVTPVRPVAVLMASTTNGATPFGAAADSPVPGPEPERSPSVPAIRVDSAERTISPSPTPQLSPKVPVAPKNLAAATARLIARTNVDSLVRAATITGGETLTDQIGTEGVIQTSSRLDDGGARPATLVGPAPVPRFPQELRSRWTEAEVVLRFRVNERGRVDVSSVNVVKSDHELFTAAVRSVLPRFRFEPARSPAPESKPVSNWVDYRVQFAATN